jgi:hypothetical protein
LGDTGVPVVAFLGLGDTGIPVAAFLDLGVVLVPVAAFLGLGDTGVPVAAFLDLGVPLFLVEAPGLPFSPLTASTRVFASFIFSRAFFILAFLSLPTFTASMILLIITARVT